MKLMRFKTLCVFLFVFGFLTLSLLPPAKASAQSSGTWINALNISVDGNNYFAKDHWRRGKELKFEYVFDGNGCTSKIKIPDTGRLDRAELEFKSREAGGTCKGKKTDITLAKNENYAIAFAFFDPQTIVRVDRSPSWTFTKSKDRDDLFLRVSENNKDCQDVIIVDKVYDGILHEHDTHKDEKSWPTSDGCWHVVVSSFGLNYGHTGEAFRFAVGPPESIVQPGRSTGDTTTGPSCESEGGEGSFLLCPLLRYADNGVEKIDRTINNLLFVPNAYFEGEAGAKLEATWKRLRNIAYIILVPIMLVMVLGTAIGFAAIDAYTVKRALPRLFAAVLFMSLSFPITIFMIRFFNDVGSGMAGLIMSSFGGVDNVDLTSLFNSNFRTDGEVILPGIFAGGLLLIAGPGIVGSFALVTIVALLIGFITLSIRQVLLVFLVLFAPLAILAWIFPGNDKLWKLWWGSFTKLLFLFPLVAGLIAFGKVFAQLVDISTDASTSGTSDDVNLLNTLLKLIAYIGPYFFIPATFKFAGGLFATLSGSMNDRSRGLFDRQKKYRARKMGENSRAFMSGDRFQGRNVLARAFNRTGLGLGTGVKGRFGFGAQGISAMDLRRRAAAQERLKNDPMLQQAAFHDEGIGVLALSGGTRAGAERISHQLAQANGWTEDQRKQAVATAAAVGFNDSTAAAALDLMAQNKSRVLTGDLAGDAGMDLVRQSAAQISHGNRQIQENLMGGFAFHSRNAGRLDLGGESAGRSMEVGWQRTSVGQHMQGFGASTEAFTRHFASTIRTGTDNQKRAAAIALAEMQGSLPYASAENQAHVNEAMASLGVDHRLATHGISVEQQLANVASGLSVNVRGTELIDPATGEVIPGPVPLVTPVITPAEIHGLARKYGGEVPLRERGDGGPPTLVPPATSGPPP